VGLKFGDTCGRSMDIHLTVIVQPNPDHGQGVKVPSKSPIMGNGALRKVVCMRGQTFLKHPTEHLPQPLQIVRHTSFRWHCQQTRPGTAYGQGVPCKIKHSPQRDTLARGNGSKRCKKNLQYHVWHGLEGAGILPRHWPATNTSHSPGQSQ
jgi:hypothetical protein